MVIPRSRSDFSLSKTQAYLKEPLPSSAASCHVVSNVLNGSNWWRVVCPSRGKILAKPSLIADCDEAGLLGGAKKRLRRGEDNEAPEECSPSRTSRWYACQFHRTCRSSL
jgi:hypothetical protein